MYVSSEKFSKKPLVKDLNSVLICPLCGGYLIDATATDCMHLFCRSCIVAYLKRQVTCPSCGENINELKRDITYQTLVYKLVPGLYDNEVLRRIEFAKINHSSKEFMSVTSTVNPIDEVVYSPQDPIMISLSYFDDDNPNITKEYPCRYLECPAIFTVYHLKKFIRKKYGLCDCHPVIISSGKLIYTDSTTLLDIAYSCAWNKQVPLELCYRLLKCHSEQVSHTDQITEEGKQSCNSHLDRTVTNETGVPSSVSIESENANSSHCNKVECVSYVLCNHETGIKNIEEIENNFEVCGNDIPNVEEIGCSSSRRLLGVKDICTMMSYVELKEKNNQTVFPEPKEGKYSESSTVNIALQDTSVKENCQNISERNGEISVTLPNVNNVLFEKCNPSISSFVETSYSTGNEAACGEYLLSTQETVSRRTKNELVSNDRNINNTTVINNEDHVGNTANCVDECRISHMYKMHNKPEMAYDIGDTCGDSNVNKIQLTCDEENDIQPFCNIRKFTLPPLCTDKGGVVATVVNTTKSSNDSKNLDSVLLTTKSKRMEGAVLKYDDKGVELLSHIASCEKKGECNNNTLQNVIEGDGVEELVTKCIETKLPLVVPKPRDYSLVNTEVPLILTEVPEQFTTDHALVEANDDDLVVQQVMEELMARHSLEGLMVEHGDEDSTAQCIAAEVNFSASTNSDCESDLSCNSNAMLANEVIDKELALECESDAFWLCDQSDECASTMQGSDVSVVDYKVTDGSSGKAVREVLPVVKYEDSVSVLTKGTENSLDKKEDYDEKPDGEIVNAVSDVNNLVSTDCKLPDLEIVRKVDGKEISVDEKDESDLLFCGGNNKHKLKSEESIKLNKIKSSLSNFVIEPDAEKLKNIVSQVFSKYEPNCELFPLQEAKLSADNLDLLSTKDKIVGLTKCDGFTRNLVGSLLTSKETLPDCLENTCTNECAGLNVGLNVCHFLDFEEEDKLVDEKVDLNSTHSRDSVTSFSNFLGFEVEDKPADEEVDHNNTLARGSVISVRSFVGFEEEDKPTDGKVDHNSTLARGSITEVHDKCMIPELRRSDEDDQISVEPRGDSSQEHAVAETFSQEFIRPVFAQENCRTPNAEVPKSQEEWTDNHNHILDHEKNEDDDGEMTEKKISRQPRIVLHRIKHCSNNSPTPQKVKVKLGKVNCQHEDVHVDSTDDVTKFDGLCLTSKVTCKFGGKPTLKNIHHQEQCPKGKKIESQITSLHQKKAKCLGSTQKLQCCNTPCMTDQENKKVSGLADNAEKLCRCEEQNKTSTALGLQISENCCVKKRKVTSIESSNASGGKKGVKRPVHKCSRLGSGFSDIGKTSAERNLNFSCNCEQKTCDKTCVVNKNHDVCSLRNGLGLRPSDKHDSGGGGPECEAALCTIEAKDVRVVVERCDGKLKQLAAFNSSPVENKDTIDWNQYSSTNLNQDVESKLPSFCVMLTRLSSSALKSTKIAVCSENKVSKTLEDTSFYHGSNTPDCEMPQPLAAKTASSVTFPSVGSSQHTSSKNTSNSKNMYSEVNSCTSVFAEEELSQDYELNINIRCGK